MAAVTQTIPNFLGGVSKQTDVKKQPGQLRECLNAYPDPTFGLMKRPGFKFIKNIYTPSSGTNPELKDAKWFFIKRDNLETYIGCILNAAPDPDGTASIHASKPIRIWNKDGTECDVTFESSPADAKLYLNTTRDNYDILTVQDTSIITNKTKEVTALAAPTDYISDSKGTVRIKTVAYSIKYEVTVKINGQNYTASFTTINAEDLPAADASTNPSTEQYNTAERILKELKGGVSGNINNILAGSIVELEDDGEAHLQRVPNATGYTLTGLSGSGSGKDAEIKIVVDIDGTPTYTVLNAGSQFKDNEIIEVKDSQLGGGIPSTISVKDGGTGYVIGSSTGVTTTGGTGSGLTVDITADSSGIITNATINTAGTGYITNDVVTVTGGGGDATLTLTAMETVAPDLKIKVKTATPYYINGLDDLAIPGDLTVTQLDASLELEFKEPTVNPIPTNNGQSGGTAGTYENLTTTSPAPGVGTGLTVDAVIENGVCNHVTVNTGGKGYAIGDTVTFSLPDGSTAQTIDAVINGFVEKPFELTTTDSQGGIHIDCYTEQVKTQADLTAQAPHGRVTKVVNLGGESDTFWLKFFADNGVSGRGSWEETKDPSASDGMDATTLPHELFNINKNEFIFRQPKKADGTLGWKGRVVGDTVTNSDPSFVGETIQQAFYHNNRLGFLTEDNVSMSKSNDFFNFYFTSALTATDDDPIDINCSSIRPAVLHAVLPTAQGLILFSRNQQFIMFSDAEILTPSSAVIRGISNYEMDATIDPVDVGTIINFVSKTPSYTRIFGMQTRGSEESPVIMDIGKVVSEWIPDTVNSLLSSPQNSLIALYGDNRSTYVGDKNIYMFKTYNVGDKIIMQAWFQWDLPGNIQFVSIDSDTMWSVIEDSGKYHLISASLTQTPEETIMTTADGQQINPHMDMYTVADNNKVSDIVTFDDDAATETARTPNTYTPAAHAKGASFQVVVADDGSGNGGAVTVTKLTSGSGYAVNDTITLASADIGGGNDITITVTAVNEKKTVVYDEAGDYSKCYIPYTDLTARNPVILIAGNASQDFAGVTEYGFTVSPTRAESEVATDPDGTYFKVKGKDLSAQADNVYVGYQYNYDVELPKTYYKLGQEGAQYDYTANLTIARMKFSVGLSSVVGFKVKSKGYRGELAEFTADGTTTEYKVPFLLKEENGIRITLDGAVQSSTDYTIARTVENSIIIDNSDTVTFTTAPAGHTVKQLYGGTGYTADSSATGAATTSNGDGTGLTVNTTVTNGVITAVTVKSQGTGYKPNEVITISGNTAGSSDATFLIDKLPKSIAITTDTWYDVQTAQDIGQYLSDDVPLTDSSIFTVPIHQRSDNFNLRVFSNSPFPVALTSMMWEGQYSPRFYRRA